MSRDISLRQVRVASPCPALWADMEGDDRVRFCRQCSLHVYNLSAMTKDEAERLISDTEGRLCIGYYQRSDGTILTQDCPLGLRLARAAARRLVGGASVLCSLVLAVVAWIGRTTGHAQQTDLRNVQPFRAVQAWLSPPVPRIRGVFALGKTATQRGSGPTQAAPVITRPVSTP